MAIEKSYIDMLKERDAKIEALRELLKLAHESLDSKDVEIAELESLLKRVSQDLLMRAELDSDGFKVVDLSSSVWMQVKKALKEQDND